MTITLRVDKGSPLTIEELDGNFVDLDGRVVVLEEGQETYRSIDEITQSGNSLTVVYTDSTTDGPFTFEVLITYRGDWVASTAYAQNDLVRANGVIYLVSVSHVSALTFDPGATSGSDGDIYIPFLEIPELQIPVGGAEGYVLAKASATDYDFEWQNRGIPDGGDLGDVLTKVSGDDLDVEWAPPTFVPITETIATTTYAPVLADANRFFRCTNSSGCVITIPHSSSEGWVVDTELVFRQCLFGPVELTGAAAVQLNGIEGYDTVTTLRGAIIHAKLVVVGDTSTDDDEWDVWGLLTPVSSDSSDVSI
jgi:hypothetical protein